jgi:tetratricopeptide (TPR) repeat protein
MYEDKEFIFNFMAQGDFDKAYRLASKLLDQDSKDWHLNYIVGQCLSNIGRAPKGVEHLRIAADGKQNEPFLLLALGIALQQDGQFQEAIITLEKASVLDPDQYESQNSLGTTYHLMSDFKKSLEHHENAARILQDLVIKELLSDLSCKELIELPHENIGDLITRISANPTFAITLSNISSCHFELGDLKSATEFAEGSIEFCPPSYRHLSPHRILKKIEKLVGQNATSSRAH